MDIKSLNVSELQDELKTRGLDTSGSHSDLILRLQTALDEEEFGIDGNNFEIPAQTTTSSDRVVQDDAVLDGDQEIVVDVENGDEEQQDQMQGEINSTENLQQNQIEPIVERKIRNSAARRAASAAKLIMSYDNPIGASPSDLEYVRLKKDHGTRNVKAVARKPINNKANSASRVGRVAVPDQLARHLKSIPPAPAPVIINPEEEEKKRNRAERFGLPLPPPPTAAITAQGEPQIETKIRGKKRNTGGIIAATNTEDDEKKRARELRFQASGLGTTDAVLQDLQEKKKRRIEKFATLRSEDLTATGGESLPEINQQEAREARYSFAIDRDVSEEHNSEQSVSVLDSEALGVSGSP